MIKIIQDTQNDWTITIDDIVIGFISKKSDGIFDSRLKYADAHKGGASKLLGSYPSFEDAKASLLSEKFMGPKPAPTAAAESPKDQPK